LIDFIANINFVLCMAVIALGLIGMLTKRNIIKIIIGLGVIDTGINMFIVSLGYKGAGTAPIMTGLLGNEVLVDPIPQALTLTSIVIGASVTALALSIAIKIYKECKTLRTDEIGKDAGATG